MAPAPEATPDATPVVEDDEAECIVNTSQEIVVVEIAALGLTVIEVKRNEEGV